MNDSDGLLPLIGVALILVVSAGILLGLAFGLLKDGGDYRTECQWRATEQGRVFICERVS